MFDKQCGVIYSALYMGHKLSSQRVPIPVRRAQRILGESIATWRKLRGLTQAQLAERADVSRGVIHRIEAADGGGSIENLIRVLRALGIQDLLTEALDPLTSDVGRLRSGQELPRRVRPRKLTGDD
jgi:transcriptional regulator with XRE-family HTH domain